MLDFVVYSLCTLGICVTVQGYLHFIRLVGESAGFSRVVGCTELTASVLYPMLF
jgi:hypothetical protein